MSVRDRAAVNAEKAHERARSLASDSIDVQLAPVDASWLAEHLRGCDECRSIAADYRALHDELRALPMPEPPRDLWARTSAALDAVDRPAARRAAGSGSRFPSFAWTRSSLASLAAVALVVVLVGLSLFSRGPLFGPSPASSSPANVAVATSTSSSGPEAAVAVVGGNSYWVTPDNGVYQIKGGAAVCTGTPDSCAVTNSNGTVLGSVASKTNVSVVISPRAAEAAVWTASKIVIMPLGTSKPATVSIDLLTPRPSATPRATAVPSVAATPPPSIEPGASPVATEKATPTLAPATTQPPAPTVTPAAGQAIAILDGYTVVGRNPEFSPNGVWVAFSARRVGAASGSDVYVWRVGWDRAQAVTTGHAALFAGWLGQRTLITQFGSAVPAPTAPAASAQPSDSSAPTPAPATAVPAAPAAIVATSYVYDPATAAAGRIDRPMLMPVVDPMGRYVVYWAGTVRLDASSGLWVPSQGDFYFDTWTNIPVVSASLTVAPVATPAPTPIPTPAPTATPTEIASTPSPAGTATATSPASPGTEKPAVGQAPSLGQASAPPDVGPSLPQLLPVASKPGTLTGWSVKWDASGQYMAIWVANPGSLDVGHVFLFDVIPGQNLLDVDGVLLSTSARSNIAFDDSQFVYTSPTQGGDGKTYLFALPAVPPPPAATPTATVAAVDSTRPAPTDSAAASTDRPGS